MVCIVPLRGPIAQTIVPGLCGTNLVGPTAAVDAHHLVVPRR